MRRQQAAPGQDSSVFRRMHCCGLPHASASAAHTLCVVQNPFEVGDEIHFFHSNKVVEGFVIDIGW